MARSRVPNEPLPLGQPFGVDVVKQLAELMSQHELNEIDIDTDVGRLRLRRGLRAAAPAVVLPPTPPAVAPTPQSASAAPAQPSKSLLEIKSEAIGTFYSRPNPESDPYVKVGSKISPTTIVGLIEAMKMFNEVAAGVSGTIAEVLIDNQQAVEYGTVLFRVEPS